MIGWYVAMALYVLGALAVYQQICKSFPDISLLVAFFWPPFMLLALIIEWSNDRD